MTTTNANFFDSILHKLDTNQRDLADILARAEISASAPPPPTKTASNEQRQLFRNQTPTTSNPLLYDDTADDHHHHHHHHQQQQQHRRMVSSTHSRMTSSGSVSSFLDEDSSAPVSVTIAENRLHRDGSVEHIERHLSLDDLSKELRGNTVYSDKSKMWKLNRRVRKSNQHLDQLALEKSPSKIAINIQPATPVSPPTPSNDMFTFEPPTPTPTGLGQVTTESLRDLLNPKAHGFDNNTIPTMDEDQDDDDDDDDDDEDEHKKAGSDDVVSNYSSADDDDDDDDELNNSLQRNRNDIGFGEFREHSVQAVVSSSATQQQQQHQQQQRRSPSGGKRDRSHSVPSTNTHEMKVFDQRRPVEMDVFKQGVNDNDDDATELMDMGARVRTDPRYAALASLKQRIDGFHQQVVTEIDMLTTSATTTTTTTTAPAAKKHQRH